MNKKKIIIFILILFICPIGLVIKDKLESKDDIYVLTEEEKSSDESMEEQEIKKEENNITDKKITVYVSGAVNKPGIVTLNEGDRLAKAVEKVGGTTKKADLNGINMAIKLQDEMHYIVPRIGEVVKDSASEVVSEGNFNQAESSKTSQININTATIEELDKLPGVGEATANKIVNHRSENGEFKSIEEIKNLICVK